MDLRVGHGATGGHPNFSVAELSRSRGRPWGRARRSPYHGRCRRPPRREAADLSGTQHLAQTEKGRVDQRQVVEQRQLFRLAASRRVQPWAAILWRSVPGCQAPCRDKASGSRRRISASIQSHFAHQLAVVAPAAGKWACRWNVDHARRSRKPVVAARRGSPRTASWRTPVVMPAAGAGLVGAGLPAR